ncbi:dolichyl-P-Man:Man(5)GlcNAc(2)-PP-dolichol alpha-1,3-mannosyltransferase [Coemansia sp. RSA 1813]|nr:dolichyl-P-Man:Man(5)GlcNAc(2)-PP-dolichol alpha-1,3-mannosyltransferase [Coemansia sp. RSA 1813]
MSSQQQQAKANTDRKQRRRVFLGAALALLSAEALLNTAIIQRVAYTEIDWHAYMQEIEGVASGERNYLKLAGDTGPLVYPAGFVWIYRALRAVTDCGKDIRQAQHIFMAVYLATLAAVLGIYGRAQANARIHPAMLAVLALSKRLHSIYVLRLFNDTVAMLFAYLAVLAMTSAVVAPRRGDGSAASSKRLWVVSTLLLSTGISVKMNVQLMLPGFAYVWLRAGGLGLVLKQLALIVLSQAIVAAPFLIQFPSEYLARAFDFGRQFDFTWTVNWRFVGESVFASPQWALGLLVTHLGLLAVLGLLVWPRLSQSSALDVLRAGLGVGQRRLSNRHPAVTADEAIAVVFTANFVGVVCARSLHYQFYSWYAHTLPLLLHISYIPMLAQPVLWLMIEYAWNVYPSTTISSLSTASEKHLPLL